MKDVIEMLLNKQATLEADREAEKALACEKIDADYADRAGKITALLDMAGYEPPVVVETDEQAVIEPVTEEAETVAENVAESAPVCGQTIY